MTIPKHSKIENCILDLLYDYKVIDTKEKFVKLIIFGDVKSNLIIKINIFNGVDENNNLIVDEKIIQLNKQYDIAKDLIDLLKAFQIIGDEAHIQYLFIKLEADKMPIVRFKSLMV